MYHGYPIKARRLISNGVHFKESLKGQEGSQKRLYASMTLTIYFKIVNLSAFHSSSVNESYILSLEKYFSYVITKMFKQTKNFLYGETITVIRHLF